MTNNLNKLRVDVVGAHNLFPKDGEGSSSAFVELKFDGMMLRTTIKEKDLNPVWNESFYFNISDPSDLHKLTLDAYVYHSVKSTSSRARSFLGKIRLTGDSFVPYSSDVVVLPYRLEKRGIFSQVRGDLRLKVYITDYDTSTSAGTPIDSDVESLANTDPSLADARNTRGNSNLSAANTSTSPTSPNSDVETIRHTSHRLPNPSQDPQQEPNHPPTAPAVSSQYEANDFVHKQTSPYLGGGRVIGGRFIHGPKTSTAYDLVEQMELLYIRVVKARNLPSMGVTGSPDPFVEIRNGNYTATTMYLQKQKNPVWNEVFAFSKDRIQASILEVVIKDKNPTQDDDFVGCVMYDLNVVPRRVPPDNPVDPEWYGLRELRRHKNIKGELMLAVWLGTQEDEAFSEACLSDAASSLNSSHDYSTVICSKVYHAPRMWYVRVMVIKAQDLFAPEKNRIPDAYVKVKLGNQVLRTKTVQDQNLNPHWNEELLFVVAEPFEDDLLLSVEDRVGPERDDIITMGRTKINLNSVDRRVDDRMIRSQPYHLERLPIADHEDVDDHPLNKESFVHLRICLEGGYHVFDEPIHYSGDLRPTAEQLWRPSIGVLELGILEVKVLHPVKTRHGRGTSDPYCVAKYGDKWVRSRTVVGDLCAKYNEPYSWEVFDPSTVLTVAVFDNSQLLGDNDTSINNNGNHKDKNIGKVRIRISTLEAGRIYTNLYSLLALHRTGIEKTGELHLAIRFSCTSFVNRVCIYSQPHLPKMHYVRPLTDMQIDMLSHHAVQIIAARFGQDEPPLRKEVVEDMFQIGSQLWSMRKSKSNFFRAMSVLSGLIALVKWFGDICMWKNPIMTVLVHVLFLMLVCFPQLIFPTAFLCMFLTGLWNFRFRPHSPPHVSPRISYADSAHPDELDEEFDTFPTSVSSDYLRMRYDRLRSVAGRVQTLVGDVATQGERIQALLSWRDSLATALFVTFCIVAALVLYVTPLQVVVALAGLFMMMPPTFRHRLPAGPTNFFLRLPARTDNLLF